MDMKEASRSGSKAVYGPERFFYDRSSYTGCHAKGGPEHVAKGGGSAADVSWKRPGSSAGAERSSRPGSSAGSMERAVVSRGGFKESAPPNPTLLPRRSGMSARDAVKEMMSPDGLKRPSSRGGIESNLGSASAAGAAAGARLREESPARLSRRLVGPERFFYDKSSYTGCHIRGGPSSVSKGGGSGSDQSWKRPA